MATPLGTNELTAFVNRWIMPQVVDNVYNTNAFWFRLNASKKKLVQGGTQIEVPLMYSRFSSGGPYSGLDTIETTPQDTVKNLALNWKQHGVGIAFDGLTLAKADTPDAIVNMVNFKMMQMEMEMAENLAAGTWSDGTTNVKDIDGLQAAINNSGTYAGINRAANPWWNAQIDTSTTMTMGVLQTVFGNATVGGRAPTIILSRQDNYNRFWNLNQISQTFPQQPGGYDEQLAAAGFHNQLFNGTPWVVDSHVPLGTTTNSKVYFLNEDYLYWITNSRADFYLEPFQTPANQDAITSKLLWYGNLAVTNAARQSVMSSLTA